MKIRTRPARSGFEWIKSSVMLVRRAPVQFAMFIIASLFATLVPASLPVVGGAASLIFAPIFGLCLCSAFRIAQNNSVPSFKDFLAPLRLGKPVLLSLFALGLINAALSLTALSISSAIDDGAMLKVMSGKMQPNDPALKSGNFQLAGLTLFALLVPIQAALWYAPQFVGWHKLGIFQSIFYSVVAVWRNKKAFAVLALTWIFLAWATMAILMIGLQGLSLLLGKTAASIVQFAAMTISPFMMAIAYGSFWTSYWDILVKNEPEHPSENAP
jgi:hypothetical protein